MKAKRSLSIKWRFMMAFAGFAAVMLILLWFLQTVFLSDFYKGIKTSEIRSTSETVVRAVFTDEIDDVLRDLVNENQVCAMVMTPQGHLVASADSLPDCLIHRMNGRDLYELYALAARNHGYFIAEFSRNYAEPVFTLNGQPRFIQNNDSIILVRLVEQNGVQRVLLLNTVISPVSATVRTLRVQLILVTIVMLIVTVILAFWLSHRVSRPVIDISRAAAELSHGSYIPYKGRGYREVMELDHTLQQAAEDLGRVEQLRRDLLANISHDLRTPLTMITGYAEVMRDLPGENTPENVQIIIDESNHLAELVNDLLDLSKLQAGVVTLTPDIFSMTELIRGIFARYSKLTENKGYELTFEFDEEAWVSADRTRISQVIYNLINNAIHYTGQSKVVHLRQTCADGQVKVEVIDNGEGIPEEQLPLVWERYYKLDRVHRRASMGTGLGLSIVQSVLELHHARYGVESKTGEGSNFWFSLERVIVPDEDLS